MNRIQPSILLLIFFVGFPQVSETIYSPILPNLTEVFQTSHPLVQQTLMVYFIGFALGTLLWGRISDQYGRRVGMLAGLSVYALASLACLASPTIYALLTARIVQGLGAAAGSVVTQSILRESYKGNAKHKAFATIGAALAFTPAIGPFLGSYLQTLFGYQSVFAFLVMMGLVLSILAYARLPETNHNRGQQCSIIEVGLKMLKDTWIWRFALLIAGVNGLIFGYYLEVPFVFTEQLHLKVTAFGHLSILIALASFMGSGLSKRLLNYFAPQQIMKLGTLFILLGGILWLTCAMVQVQPAYLTIGVVSALCLVFLGIGTMLPYCLSMALECYQGVLGTAGALLGLMYYILLSGFMGLISFLHDGSLYPFAVYIIAVGLVLFALIPQAKHLRISAQS